jgi:sugar lactone lactonase YvrE
VSGHHDGSVLLWDALTGREVRELHRGAMPYVVAFSPDGRMVIAAGRDDMLIQWEVASGRKVRSFNGHHAHAMCAAFSPDGSLIASTDYNNGIQFRGMTRGVRQVAFSPNSRTLATASYRGPIRLWEIETGSLRAQFDGHVPSTTALAFSPDGTTLLSAGMDTTALLWDVTLRRERGNRAKLTDAELERAWIDLGSADGRTSYQQIWLLADAAEEAIPRVKEKLQAARKVPKEQIQKLVADLESDVFAVREKSHLQLRALAGGAQPLLRDLAKQATSAEVRRRLALLLEDAGAASDAQRRRLIRTVEFLEHIGTEPARVLLVEIASNSVEEEASRQAQAALQRLGKQRQNPPVRMKDIPMAVRAAPGGFVRSLDPSLRKTSRHHHLGKSGMTVANTTSRLATMG